MFMPLPEVGQSERLLCSLVINDQPTGYSSSNYDDGRICKVFIPYWETGADGSGHLDSVVDLLDLETRGK